MATGTFTYNALRVQTLSRSVSSVSLSRVSERHEGALYCSKAHMNDNENVIYRVSELFECCKISSQFYTLSFPSFVYPAISLCDPAA